MIPDMVTLSLAMIVKNEAANLPRCLASLRGLVDEMVVVDTGSTDDTVAIAESYGARLGHFTWCDDFAAARNECLGLCTGDWVVVLDADEAIDTLDHARIRQAIARAPFLAFNLTIRNYYLDGGAATFDHTAMRNSSSFSEGASFSHCSDVSALRLCRRYPDLRFEGRIHEMLTPYFEAKRVPVGRLEAVIHHYGKVDLAREEAKKAYYLRLTEEEATAHPGDTQRLFNFMSQAQVAGEWDKALAAAEAYMQLVQVTPVAVLLTAAMAHQQGGRHDAALDQLQAILKKHPNHTLALNQVPISLAFLGRIDESLAALEKAIALEPGFTTSYLTLAEILGQLGRFDEARDALRRGIAFNPEEERLRQILVTLDIQHGREAMAVSDAWEAIRAIPSGGRGHWHALVAAYFLNDGKAAHARSVLNLGLLAFPGHERLQHLSDKASEA